MGGPPREKREVDNKKYYEILGVDKDVTAAKLKKSYYALAKTKHPDKGGDPDEVSEPHHKLWIIIPSIIVQRDLPCL